MNDQNQVFAKLHALQFLATHPHKCSYLPKREAVTLFVDPRNPIDNRDYSLLSSLGFRRSGDHIYRPHCRSCQACIPIRIPVAAFKPNRSQRRTWRRNEDLIVESRPPGFTQEHFDLYHEYILTRHPKGGMDDDKPDNYLNFISSRWSHSTLYEFRCGPKLLAVAVTDRLDNSLSAVYTYFDVYSSKRALGVYSVLWQVDEARRLGLNWLYLGYWIKESPKMAYKQNYRPFEYFDEEGWKRFS